MKTPPYRRNSGDLAKPGPVLRRYWLILFMLGGILAMVALIAGSRTGVVLECWLEAAFIIPVVLVAAMVGMALTLPLAKEGLFAHSSWPDGLRAIMAIALGLGVLALATLALGACHALAHGVPMIMLAFGAIIGYIPTRTYVIKFDRTVFTNALGKGELALLLACVPIAVMAIAATVPPGHQWASEFGGYDVMEYHLEMPREYVQANATAPVQHNVYSFLPANVEMLYVLLMLLTRSAGLGHLGAVYPAQMLHMIMMLLTAGGLALAPVRMGGVTGGGGGGLAGRMVVFVALLAVPWVEVTGSMAYDEGGVMLFGALALGIVVGGHRGPWSVVATGLLIGLAVGSKMTAGVLVAAPLGLIVLIQRRWWAALAIVALALLVYSPWAIRAAVGSHGNPVFPIAANTLGMGHWDHEQVARWNKTHGPQAKDAGLAGRISAFAREGILDGQWSPSLGTIETWLDGKTHHEPLKNVGFLWFGVAAAVLLALMSGRILGWELVLVLTAQCAGWMAFTHLQGRFLLPIALPIALLMGLAMDSATASMWGKWSQWGRIIVGAAVCWQVVTSAFLLWPELGLLRGPHDDRGVLVGMLLEYGGEYRFPEALAQPDAEGMRPRLGEGITTYLIGDATPLYYHGEVIYNTVWDKCQLAEQMRAAKTPADTLEWLRKIEGVDYLVINWSEVARFRRSYGFPDEIVPERIKALGLGQAFPAARPMEVYAVR